MAKSVELGLKSTKMEAGTKASGIMIKKWRIHFFRQQGILMLNQCYDRGRPRTVILYTATLYFVNGNIMTAKLWPREHRKP